MLGLEMEVLVDLLPAFWTPWPLSTFLHGATVLDMTTEYSNNLSKTVINARHLTFGWLKEILGKLRELM